MRRVLREVVLTVGAIAGGLGIALAVATLAFGMTPVVVTSGSMAPSIDTGSLAFARTVPAGDLAVGDVVAVVGADGRRVMHRIAAIVPADADPAGTEGRRTLTLRGDANLAPDVETYTVAEAERVVGSVGGAGYVLTWLGRPEGLLTTGALVALALLLGFGPAPSRPARDRPARDRTARDRTAGRPARPALRRGVASALVIVLVAATIAAGAHTVTSSRAAWTDQGTAASGTFAAHTVLAPATAPVCTNMGGALGLLGYVQLTWPHRDTRYAYPYTVTRVSDSAVVATGTVTTAGAAGSTVTFNLTSALITGVLLANTNFDVTIRSALSASPTWVSAGSWVTRVHSVNIVLIGLSLRCGSAP